MARALGVGQSAAVFLALKDKDAVVVPYVAARSTGPARLTGNGFEAEFVGRSPRPLTPADIVANRFTIALRDLSAGEAAHILRKAYLPKGKRALLLFLQDTSASLPEPDGLFPGQCRRSVAFTLPRASYATLVIKGLAA